MRYNIREGGIGNRPYQANSTILGMVFLSPAKRPLCRSQVGVVCFVYYICMCTIDALTGTGIEVFGTVEETAESGTPTSQYSINETIIDIFEAPFVATGDILHNVRYFSKRDLPRGNYEIKVTKLDSLTSNELWLDYFLVWDEASPPAIPSAIPPISQPESSSNLPTAPSRHSTPSSTSSVRSSTHT